jgi:hypothetical protein
MRKKISILRCVAHIDPTIYNFTLPLCYSFEMGLNNIVNSARAGINNIPRLGEVVYSKAGR